MKFECQESCGGKCCKVPQDRPTFVFLTSEDRSRLFKFMGGIEGVDVQDYAVKLPFNWTRFTKRKGYQWVLLQPNHKCVFLDDKGKCKVYEARPTQCRTFPFWPEIFRDHKEWEAFTEYCPGIGKGKEFTPHMIIEKFREQIEADEKADRETN